MKQLHITFLITVLMSMVGVKASAHDIAVKNADGVTIYYLWTNNGTELSVTYRGEEYDSYTNEYTGSVNIPVSVTYNEKTYLVTSIGYGAFEWCSDLTSVTIPSSVTSIGDWVFEMCTGLTSVTIPNSVTSIGKSAFSNCRSLTSVTIPSSVTSIGNTAFRICWSLASINVESGNPKYDSRNNCNAIIETSSNTLIYGCNNTVIPNSVTSIGNEAFAGCTGLTSIIIPNSVTSIGSGAFLNCSGLTSITIPSSVTSINSWMFYYCSNLTNVNVSVIDYSEFCNNSIVGLIPQAINGIKSVHLIDEVGNEIKEYVIPNSVTSIGASAFEKCSGLASITIPNSVTSIGDEAFYDCSGLTSVTIPNSITTIGSYAFYNCSGLTSVTVEWPEPISISSNVFSNSANATLHVPYGSKAVYKAANYWKRFKEIVEYVKTADLTDISTLDNVIYLDEVQAVPGSQKTISIKMKNSAAIRGFQFNMTLPEGVTPATYSNGTIMCSVSAARRQEGDKHTISVKQQADGSYQFLCGSLENETFTGTDGEVLTLKINIADNVPAGDYPITLSSIKLTETNINNYYETAEVVSKLTISDYELGDINGDGVVDVSDYIGVANHILGDTPAGFNALAADVNGDHVIDISDYIGIANIILTGSIYGNNAGSRPFVEDEEPTHEPQ